MYDWWSYMLHLWDHQYLYIFLCWVSFHVISFLFKIYLCWRCSVCQDSFHKLIIWTTFMWSGVTRARSVFIWWSVSRGGLHRLRVWMKSMWIFFLIVYLGTCIGNFCKHIRYVVIQSFHIRVMFVSHGYDVIVNFVQVIFW